MLKFNNKKNPRRRQWRHSFVIVNFEHISHLFLVFLYWQLNVSWVHSTLVYPQITLLITRKVLLIITPLEWLAAQDIIFDRIIGGKTSTK